MTERKCNECTLCCKLIPVPEISKADGQRCNFQRMGKGCTIHETSRYPRSCKLWSCGWLLGIADLPRPDRAHYVIDLAPDFVELDRNDGTPRVTVPVIQLWIDPKYPHAHRDQALRAWLAERFRKTGEIALVRSSSNQATTLFPPGFFSNHHEWHEDLRASNVAEHSAAEIVQRLGWHPPS